MNVTILSVKYEEFEWLKTRECVEACGLSFGYVDRDPKGIGNLSQAINAGVKEIGTEFTFIVTNITFQPNVIKALYDQISEIPSCAAICPAYNSDHPHLRKGSYEFGHDLIEVPFIEFTAGIFRTSLLKEYPLDEQMPYVGMDLHWSKQVKEGGYHVASLKSVEIDHSYLRHLSPETVTKKRLAARRASDSGTIKRLESIYGKDWRNILGYRQGIASK